MSRYALALALMLAPEFPSAQTESQQEKFDGIMSALVHPELLRAEFTQVKKMHILKRPLVSSGKMIYLSGEGVVWIIEEPYPIKLHITPSGAVENISEESSPQQPDPFARMISRIFLSALAGDLTMLTENFEIAEINYSAENDPQWSIRLSPRDESWRRFVRALNLDGGKFINEIEIVEANGDTTLLNFRQQAVQPEALNAGENAYFFD